MSMPSWSGRYCYRHFLRPPPLSAASYYRTPDAPKPFPFIPSNLPRDKYWLSTCS